MPTPAIKLLATDLDDTLIGRGSEFHLYEAFGREIEAVRRNNGVWVVCTSRRLKSVHRLLSPLRVLGIAPDFIVARHAYIYRPAPGILYWPRAWWNVRIAFMQLRLAGHVRCLTARCKHRLLQIAPDAHIVHRRNLRIAFQFSSDSTLQAASAFLKKDIADFPALKIKRFNRSLALIEVPYTKGLALAEVARHLNIVRDQILAIGDGLNDISMLDGTVAGMTGCPKGSKADVVKHVADASGHISAQSALAGVLDIIQAHRGGSVNSTLPSDWQDPNAIDYGKHTPLHAHRSQRHRILIRHIVIWCALFYLVLLILAQYNLLPLSWLIRLPFTVMMKVLVRLTGSFVP